MKNLYNFQDYKLYEAINCLFEQEITLGKSFIQSIVDLHENDTIAAFINNFWDINNFDELFLDIEDDEKSKIKNITSVDLSDNKSDYVVVTYTKPDGREAKQEMKLGKLITAILKQIKKKPNIKPNDIEKFVSNVNAIQSGTVISDYEFRLVEGKDIVKYYNMKQSEKLAGGLAGSCMRFASCAPYINFYAKYCKGKVKLLIYVNKVTDKIAGRALVWDTDEGKYMDRIYAQDDKLLNVFLKWADDNVIKNSYNGRDNTSTPTVFCKGWKTETEMPYMDTFECGYLDVDGLWLSKYDDIDDYPGKKEVKSIFGFREQNGSYSLLFGDFAWGSIDTKYSINVSESNLKSLKGAPEKVNGDFNCGYNDIHDLEGCPQIIKGYFDCSRNSISSLVGGPKEVETDYYCYANELRSLDGSPKNIYGNFDCSDNRLNTLLHGPEIVHGSFNCSGNMLKSLQGFPKEIYGDVDFRSNYGPSFTEEEVRAICHIDGKILV